MSQIANLQYLVMGMVLSDYKLAEEIDALGFADDEFSQLFSVIKYDAHGKEEKQQAIADFVLSKFGVWINLEERDHWRAILLGLLHTNGKYMRARRKLSGLEGYNTKTAGGQIAFLQHFKEMAKEVADAEEND